MYQTETLNESLIEEYNLLRRLVEGTGHENLVEGLERRQGYSQHSIHSAIRNSNDFTRLITIAESPEQKSLLAKWLSVCSENCKVREIGHLTGPRLPMESLKDLIVVAFLDSGTPIPPKTFLILMRMVNITVEDVSRLVKKRLLTKETLEIIFGTFERTEENNFIHEFLWRAEYYHTGYANKKTLEVYQFLNRWKILYRKFDWYEEFSRNVKRQKLLKNQQR